MQKPHGKAVFKCGILFEQSRGIFVTYSAMHSKTLTTVLIVIICVLLFPVVIGLIGGVFGIIGSIIGGLFGLIGGVFGAVFGLIGGLFAAVFSFIGWIFGFPFHWDGPGFFHNDLFTVVILVLVIVMISRARNARPKKSP